MNFKQILESLKQGKKVTRQTWQSGSYWIIDKKQRICFNDGTPAIVSLKHIEANDWKIYEDKKTLWDKNLEETFLRVDNVKQYLKEFLDWLVYNVEMNDIGLVDKKAKEVFGEELL